MMDRRRAPSPVIGRQWSGSSSNDSSSPAASPVYPDTRQPITAISTVKRTQNVAAKAAARRLAQVMASQAAADEDDDDDEDNDLGLRSGPPALTPHHAMGNAISNNSRNSNFPLFISRPNRSQSPAFGRNFADHIPSAHSTSAVRRSTAVHSAAVVQPSRSSLRTAATIPPIELPSTKLVDRRLIPDVGHFNLVKGDGNQNDANVLRDELDVLQEENDHMLEKLRHAEEKREEAEARARQLEQQVASLGDGISLEAKLLSRKEAALRQKEAALKADKQNKEGKEGEIASLRLQIQNLKDEAAASMVQFQEAESEARGLRTVTWRMLLSQEEMEEVVLKRCWLARYWGLAIQYGICTDIAASKYEHWSALAPLPFEVVISAGQKAKEDFLAKVGWSNPDKQNKSARDPSDLTAEGNIETMLSVEMGLRELALLKIEDAVILAMAQSRRPTIVRDPRSSADPKLMEAFELSQAQSDDVVFKQAWLTYFWKRANDHEVEVDIAEERIQYWTSRIGLTATSHDAVDVEHGLVELRKLGIEQQLWEASRREIEQPQSGPSERYTRSSESEAYA